MTLHVEDRIEEALQVDQKALAVRCPDMTYEKVHQMWNNHFVMKKSTKKGRTT